MFIKCTLRRDAVEEYGKLLLAFLREFFRLDPFRDEQNKIEKTTQELKKLRYDRSKLGPKCVS